MIKTYHDFINEAKPEGYPLTKVEIGKIKYFYHATHKDNLYNIMDDGINTDKIEKVVYLADSFEHAAIFLAVRGMMGKIVVFKIDASKLDKKKLEESFDHSYGFFKCRAYIYAGEIPADAIDQEEIMTY